MKRINPHLLNQGFIGPQGIKRIARAGSSHHSEVEFRPPEQQPVAIAKPEGYIMVVLHAKEGKLSALDREVLYVGRVLAGRASGQAVLAVVFGELEDDMTAYGVDRKIVLATRLPENRLENLEKLQGKYHPFHILFGEGDIGDSDLARRLAVSVRLSIATGVIEIDDKRLRRICDNGLQQGTRELTDIIVLTSGVAETELDFITEARSEEWQGDSPSSYEHHDYSLATDDIPLEEASFIVAAGNGVANMESFFRLAKVLGASIGGSRVVVDDGKLPRDKQIGATGKSVAASVYIAIGISGAVQHLQGINECGTVIAVNIDDSCDMVKRADIAIICDAEEWMQEMIMQIESLDIRREAG